MEQKCVRCLLRDDCESEKICLADYIHNRDFKDKKKKKKYTKERQLKEE